MPKIELVNQIKEGKHPQFVYNNDKQMVTCRCGQDAVWMRNGYLCPTITAYPCEYSKPPKIQ
ncbi:hypothetical protein JCM30204_07870 [Dysgonomonas termitidis]